MCVCVCVYVCVCMCVQEMSIKCARSGQGHGQSHIRSFKAGVTKGCNVIVYIVLSLIHISFTGAMVSGLVRRPPSSKGI